MIYLPFLIILIVLFLCMLVTHYINFRTISASIAGLLPEILEEGSVGYYAEQEPEMEVCIS